MAKIKNTKSAVDAAQPQAQPVELRDTLVPGFLCKITPAGRKVFMLQYRTNAGERRKPALGLYGELTVEQARSLAQNWLAEVRRGGDPGGDKAQARQAPTVKELCTKFMEDYSKQRNKPSTQHGYQSVIDRNIIPILGRMKVQDVKRPDVAAMMKKMAHKPADANRAFSVMRKMFNLAEVWGHRTDGTNPCRHVPMFPAGKSTHLISDEEMGKLFRHLDQLEAEGLESCVIPLAIRLQFEFAARRSEIVLLEWAWVDLEQRRVVWPDSKTGGMSKPISEEAYRLLSTAPRYDGSLYVLPSPRNPMKHLTTGEYYNGWSRALKAAGVTHVGTHGIRQAWGGGNHAKARAVAGTALALVLSAGLLVSIFGGLLAPTLLTWLGTPANILADATIYARLMMVGAPLIFLLWLTTSMSRGVGDAVTPLWTLLLATLMGLVFTPAFIRGWGGLPQLGVASAAVSTMLILPDTSSFQLDKLVGTDPAGYAGLEDGVDWHWDRVFAGAALTTLLGIGAELAAPENRNGGDCVIIAGRDSLKDSVNQVGQEMTRRNMNMQPTLTERPGLPVRVIVNRDLVLRPYQPLFFVRGGLR